MMDEYSIKRSDGTVFANIPANIIVGPNISISNMNPTPINLIGRNRISYGKAQNENFLWLTENFSSNNAPLSTIIGQLWYKNKQQAGQLLLSVVDNARNPVQDDATTEHDWGVIPVITLQNNLPNAAESLMGRMVLTNNGDALKVVMKNKEWREIQTIRPTDKQYEKLLDIEYDTGKNYVSFTASKPSKAISYFNYGAAENPLPSGYYGIKDGEGSLRFGSTYFFEIKVLGRRVDLVNGSPVSRPAYRKAWKIIGTFYIDNEGTVDVTSIMPSQLPDPRKISGLSYSIDTIDDNAANTDGWSISVTANSGDPALSALDLATKEGFQAYVQAALNSHKHYGIKIGANINSIPSGQTIYTQWSVFLEMTGIPPLGV